MKTLTEEDLEEEFKNDYRNAWNVFKSTPKPFTRRREVGPQRVRCIKDCGDGYGVFVPEAGGPEFKALLSRFNIV